MSYAFTFNTVLASHMNDPFMITLGGEVAATAAKEQQAAVAQPKNMSGNRSIESSYALKNSTVTRPKLHTSKQTDSKLEEIGMKKKKVALIESSIE